jgi:5-methylcytosine-specific restriction endonuclease McrA
MDNFTLPQFAPDLPAAAVDASLRQALGACDRARECAVLWFAEVQRRALYRALGFASLEIYAVEGLGFSPNRYWQFKRLADDLDRLPVLREAVATGGLGWTKAQQVARVATPETQAAWVMKAAVTGRRELEREVRDLRRRKSGMVELGVGQAGMVPIGVAQVGVAQAGVAQPESAQSGSPTSLFADPTPAPTHPLPATITLRGDGLQIARFEALLEKTHKLGLIPAGADRLEAVLAALESLVTGQAGAAAAHGPATQIVIHQCPDCGGAAAVTHRGELPLAPAQVAAAACDARVRTAGGANKATIPPKMRAAVLARDRHRCTTPGCSSTRFLEVHHVTPRAQGGTNRLANLVTLCSRCHRFAHEHSGTRVSAQAHGRADAATDRR